MNPTLVTLSTLGSVTLVDDFERMYADATRHATGDPIWRRRKCAELKPLVAFCQVAPYRLKFLSADLEAEPMRVAVAMRVPVPLQPQNNGPMRRAEDDWAILGITYPRDLLLGPLAGTRFVTILCPEGVWHPNVTATFPHVLCLGATLPRGIPLVELLVLTYASLSLTLVTTDRMDPAGLLNGEAAQYFEAAASRGEIPLTREPFLRVARPGVTGACSSEDQHHPVTGGGQ